MIYSIRRAFPLAASLAAKSLSIVSVLALFHSQSADAQFDPYANDFSREAIDERRELREDARKKLASRVEDNYRLSVPIVSPEIIDATRAAIARYETVSASGGWSAIPDNLTLRLDDTNPHVENLRSRFVSTGAMQSTGVGSPLLFDQAMQEAVGRYQLSNGLDVTGFVDHPTRRALNVPLSTRLRQLRENLARLEGLAAKTGAGRYVLVNAPAFTLQAVDGGQLMLDSRVVIGKPTRQTPDMSVKINELNFHPPWRVPQSVVERDLIPKLRIDPGLLEREHFSVSKRPGGKKLDPSSIDWNAPESKHLRFRQEPGPWNALGALRINMPNKQAIFLHDTPHKNLYDAHAPAFSAGCIRVERVKEISSWLAEGVKGWDEARVAEVLSSGKPQSVRLTKQVPVHLVYVTAWATNDGLVHFRPDIYRRDGAEDAGETELVAGADALAP